jgi:hypothetical protein
VESPATRPGSRAFTAPAEHQESGLSDISLNRLAATDGRNLWMNGRG